MKLFQFLVWESLFQSRIVVQKLHLTLSLEMSLLVESPCCVTGSEKLPQCYEGQEQEDGEVWNYRRSIDKISV